MRVSERLQHGFWTWALIFAIASIGLQVQAMGQTGSPADNSNSFVPEKTTEDTGGSLDKNGPAKMALLKARQALAHGDVTTAEMMVKSANQYKVDDFPPGFVMMILDENWRYANHFPTRVITFFAGRYDFLSSQQDRWFTLRSSYRGQVLESKFHLEAQTEGGYKLIRIDEVEESL